MSTTTTNTTTIQNQRTILKNLKSYTWEELSKHNRIDDAWVAIDGKIYDITKFIPNHPGGTEFLRISAGRDCTDLFKSYHVFTNKPDSILPKYLIGTLSTYELPTYKPDSGFYKECAAKVKEYFSSNKIHPKDPIPGIWREILFVGVMLFSYLCIYSFKVNFVLSMLLCVLFGVTQALCLMHQLHDSSHGSIGPSNSWWNFFGILNMELISGASTISWRHQHVLGHHIYTNIMDADPDLPALIEGDLRYLVKRQVWKQLYKYQHIYMPILYGLLALKFRIQDFTCTFGTLMNGRIRVNELSMGEWTHLILTKLFYISYRIIIPIYFFGNSVLWSVLSFLFIELATGYMLAFNFQVSHISTEAFFPSDKKFEPNLEKEWAVSQVLTSVDYAHGDFLATFLSGALNYQTVHHLFPGVSQYHYPAIAPIVQSVCKKYGVPYTVLPSFSAAFNAHLQYMYKMGNSGEMNKN